MEDLLAYLARAIVDDPDAVVVDSFEEDDGTIVLELEVAEGDAGKVIGRGGRTIAALRTVVKASVGQGGPPRARRRGRLGLTPGAMTAEGPLVTAGRVGRPHGLDGTFSVLEPQLPLEVGTVVTVAGTSDGSCSAAAAPTSGRWCDSRASRIARLRERWAGSCCSRPDGPLAEGEWLAADLVGCSVDGGGTVSRVLAGPSCDVLELDDGTLVPLVTDAVKAVDAARRRIEIDRRFLGMGDPA